LLRTATLTAAGALGLYVARRVVDERRAARRLATPVTTWPPVPLEEDDGEGKGEPVG
jgi:hypothetical protein